jgi:hypothetical protein
VIFHHKCTLQVEPLHFLLCNFYRPWDPFPTINSTCPRCCTNAGGQGRRFPGLPSSSTRRGSPFPLFLWFDGSCCKCRA